MAQSYGKSKKKPVFLVGTFVLRDALKGYKSNKPDEDEEEKVSKIARWVQSVNIPGTMAYFKCLKARVSLLFIIPLGFATGMLAATIAVGGFIGVPSMIYVLGRRVSWALPRNLLWPLSWGWAVHSNMRCRP